jgi:hypothetical protein
MATRSSATPSRSASSRSTRPPAARRRRRQVQVAPDLVRQLLGVIFLILGVTLLIGLTIQNGQLTDWERNAVAPDGSSRPSSSCWATTWNEPKALIGTGS